MFHSQVLAESGNHSTVAAYFLYGIQAGFFPENCAKEWAFAIIEAEANPSINIIEVATANHREAVFQALKAVAATGCNTQLAGRWLLSHLQGELN